MKISNIFLLITIVCMSSTSWADSAAEEEAGKLLDLMQTEKLLEQSISQTLDIQLQQNPALAPYKGVMMEFLNRHMSYESLKPDMLRIYAEAFTTSELRELNSFYATEVGKKTIEKVPTLMAQGGQIAAARVQENAAELQAMIEAESERIQKLQSE